MSPSNLLFRLSPRLHLRACMAYYSFRYGIVSNCINALWALFLAWKLLSGKLLIIDSQNTVSKGGYRYRTITFSKRPVSAGHTYEDL